MRIETVGREYKRNKFQKRLSAGLRTEKRVIAIFAGWRSGKTDWVSVDHVVRRQVEENPDVLHLIAANTYSQLIDSTLRTLFRQLDWIGVPHVPDQLPRSARPFSLYVLGTHGKWVEFLCRSMDNFDTVAGTTLGSVWLDEVWGTEKWTYELANSRLSDAGSKHLQLVLTSTKDEPDHWMYKNIVEPFERNEELNGGERARDVIEIVEGTTYENEGNLAPGYIASLKATTDPRIFQRHVENKWVSVAEGRAYPYFDADAHRRVLGVPSDGQRIICLDFDLNPCVWVLGWTLRGGSYFDCEILQRDTDIWKMCAELKSKLISECGDADSARQRRTIFYGDYQHGTGRSLSATASSWSIVESEFAGWNVDFRRKPNPRILDRVNATNARMRSADGSVRLWVSPDCQELIKDWQLVTWDDLRNHAGSNRTHAASAVDYYHNYEYPATGKQTTTVGAY